MRTVYPADAETTDIIEETLPRKMWRKSVSLFQNKEEKKNLRHIFPVGVFRLVYELTSS